MLEKAVEIDYTIDSRTRFRKAHLQPLKEQISS
jgi:hypothetical protein